MSLSDADRYLQVVRNTVRVLSETSETPAIWHDLVCRYSVRGAQVHDARIVAVMLSHRVHSIITMNTADFARYREVEAIHPGDRERLETI